MAATMSTAPSSMPVKPSARITWGGDSTFTSSPYALCHQLSNGAETIIAMAPLGISPTLPPAVKRRPRPGAGHSMASHGRGAAPHPALHPLGGVAEHRPQREGDGDAETALHGDDPHPHDAQRDARPGDGARR